MLKNRIIKLMRVAKGLISANCFIIKLAKFRNSNLAHVSESYDQLGTVIFEFSNQFISRFNVILILKKFSFRDLRQGFNPVRLDQTN